MQCKRDRSDHPGHRSPPFCGGEGGRLGARPACERAGGVAGGQQCGGGGARHIRGERAQGVEVLLKGLRVIVV